MSDLEALLEKVKAASGADRALDIAIAETLVPDVLVMRRRDDDSGADPYTYWKYTASIDDALGLVERMLPHYGYRILVRALSLGRTIDRLALAILAALLSALIAKQGEK